MEEVPAMKQALQVLGAMAVILFILVVLSCLGRGQTVPSIVNPPVKTQAVYAVVWATGSNVDGFVSPELGFVATNNRATVGWGPTNGTGYAVMWGTNKGEYRWMLSVGTNTALAIEAVPTPKVTNYIGLYAQGSTNGPGGPWFEVNLTPFVRVTNVTGGGIPGPQAMFYRVRINTTNSP